MKRLFKNFIRTIFQFIKEEEQKEEASSFLLIGESKTDLSAYIIFKGIGDKKVEEGVNFNNQDDLTFQSADIQLEECTGYLLDEIDLEEESVPLLESKERSIDLDDFKTLEQVIHGAEIEEAGYQAFADTIEKLDGTEFARSLFENPEIKDTISSLIGKVQSQSDGRINTSLTDMSKFITTTL